MLAVLTVQTEIPARHRIDLELVGDQRARRAAVLPEQLVHQEPGHMSDASALHQNVEHRAMPVRCTPQSVFLHKPHFF